MGFFRDISPKRAVRDLWTVWKGENPHRWRVLAVSIALTTGILILAIPASQYAEPERPSITYISTFAPDRTDEEIMASNLAAHERKEQRLAEQQARDEFRRELYRQLGSATGLDTAEMERQIEAERATEEAERQRRLEQFRQGADSGTDTAE